MPTYEYACAKCGHHFEHSQSMLAKRLTKCPKCGKNSLKRLIGAGAGLIFKGTGFYITDYKKTPSASEKEKKASGEGKPSGGESKPAAEAKPAAPAKSEPKG